MEKIKFNITDYVVSHFIANDKYRPMMNKAYHQNGFVYASDSHILIKVPKELCAKQYEDVVFDERKIPNFEKVMNEVELSFVAEISINEVLPCLENIKIKYSGYETDCKECDGDGEVECECCGNSSDCKECDGTGKTKHSGKIMVRDVCFTNDDNDEIRAVAIAGKNYNPVYLELVMFSMCVLGATKCQYFTCTDTKYDSYYYRGIFKFCGVEILIMGIRN